MKAMVHPYRKEADLVMTDAFRGPMASAFKLHLEDIMLFTDAQRLVLAKGRNPKNFPQLNRNRNMSPGSTVSTLNGFVLMLILLQQLTI